MVRNLEWATALHGDYCFNLKYWPIVDRMIEKMGFVLTAAIILEPVFFMHNPGFLGGFRVHHIFRVVLLCVFTVWVLCCDVRYDFCIKTMFGSSLLAVICRRAHILLTLFVFVCVSLYSYTENVWKFMSLSINTCL